MHRMPASTLPRSGWPLMVASALSQADSHVTDHCFASDHFSPGRPEAHRPHDLFNQ
jgi:hypothetical protein